jgi:hypothetical protein
MAKRKRKLTAEEREQLAKWAEERREFEAPRSLAHAQSRRGGAA